MESIATWVAPIATTIAALMTASNLGSRVTGWGFAVFTIGSIAWIALGLATGQPSLVWQNAILTLLNLLGIWRWLGRQAKLEDGGERASKASERRAGETLFPVSLLTKAKLRGADGSDLGACVDAMVGCEQGRLAYLVVASGGVGGVGETIRRVPWREARVDEGAVATGLDQARFEQIAPVPKDDWR